MKILAIILFACIFTTTTADSLDGDGFKLDIKEPLLHKIPLRDKKSLGIDKNIKKEFELKTKLGTMLKVSKTITYSDGGGLKKVTNKLHSKHKKQPSQPLVHEDSVDHPIPGIHNKSDFAHPHPAPKNHQLSNQKKALLASHKKAILLGYKKALKLKKILFLKKISDIVRAIASKKKIGPPCCPTGPCCPGRQG